MPDSSAPPATDPAAVDTLALRAALGQFATGVCIVAAPSPRDGEPPFAITVNSFASVSLRPPIVLWCLQKGSSTFDLWMATRQFGISVLNAEQTDLCARYAVSGNHWMTARDDYVLSERGTPLVPDAVAHFDCRVHRIDDAGDHKLILADVLDFRHDERRRPLVYLRGAIDGPA